MVGTMTKIDDSVKKKVPELRFKGFTDDWEEHKLGDFLKTPEKVKAHIQSKDDLMTLKLNLGGLESGSNRETLELGSTIYYKRKAGQFIYGKQNFFNGSMAIIPIDLDGKATSGDVPSLDVIGILSEYLYVYVSRGDYWKSKESEASGTGSKRIHEKTLQGFDIKVPSTQNEQRKIGSFFKQLDDIIALHQRKLDLLKEQKKGFLQKMFPKNGAKVPELRFKGFTDDWEERKLSSMTNYKNGKSHEDKQSTSGKLELINLNSISISGGLKHSGKFIDEADDTLQKDDLVMILSDVGHGDLLGRVALIPEDDRFVLNQRVALLRPNTTADPQFLFSYINAHQYYFKAQGAGMSQLNISKGSVENFISFVPIIEEQKKIGSFFKQLDDTIALHQRKLDLLKEQKKGFLQKMFV